MEQVRHGPGPHVEPHVEPLVRQEVAGAGPTGLGPGALATEHEELHGQPLLTGSSRTRRAWRNSGPRNRRPSAENAPASPEVTNSCAGSRSPSARSPSAASTS